MTVPTSTSPYQHIVDLHTTETLFRFSGEKRTIDSMKFINPQHFDTTTYCYYIYKYLLIIMLIIHDIYIAPSQKLPETRLKLGTVAHTNQSTPNTLSAAWKR